MKILCNGKARQVPEDMILSELLVELKLNPATVVVECNKSIVSPCDYDGFILPDGATLELIRFVGGG